jgi:hypothetical protein
MLADTQDKENTKKRTATEGFDMRCVEFREAIQKALRQTPEGLKWSGLRERLVLPYERPCPTWTLQLEKELGLARAKGCRRGLVWKVAAGCKFAEPARQRQTIRKRRPTEK